LIGIAAEPKFNLKIQFYRTYGWKPIPAEKNLSNPDSGRNIDGTMLGKNGEMEISPPPGA
jgi:hypothetical protein